MLWHTPHTFHTLDLSPTQNLKPHDNERADSSYDIEIFDALLRNWTIYHLIAKDETVLFNCFEFLSIFLC